MTSANKEKHLELLRRRGFVFISSLGEGSSSKVKEATSEHFADRVAIKIVDRAKMRRRSVDHFLSREIQILTTLNHPNIVKTFEILEIQTKIYFVLELASKGSLLKLIRSCKRIQEGDDRIMFRQMLEALNYLHEQKVCHRDLKCDNVLLDANNNIKLTDFGFARTFEQFDQCRTFCGTCAFAPPEVILRHPYNGFVSDIWSLGVVLFMMLTGHIPYDPSSTKRQVEAQFKPVEFPRDVALSMSDDSKMLLTWMLEANVAERPTIAQLRNSAWLFKTAYILRTASGEHVVSAAPSDIPGETLWSKSSGNAEPSVSDGIKIPDSNKSFVSCGSKENGEVEEEKHY